MFDAPNTHHPESMGVVLRQYEVEGSIVLYLSYEACNTYIAWLKTLGVWYTNKYLVVIGEASAYGWYPCTWVYDSRFIGLCHIKPRELQLETTLKGNHNAY
jgi:hypothetical protein